MFRNLYQGWWIVIACFIVNFYVGGITFFGFTAFFEPIRREFNWSYTQVSLAISLRGLEMSIFAPVVGFLVDRFGSRKLLLGGMIVVGIGMILHSFIQSLPMFYLCILLIAFGAGGCTTVVTMTAVATWFRKNLGLALGVMLSGYGAGGLIIPLIVFLIDESGWRSTLVFLGVGMLLLCIPLSLIVRDRPGHPGLEGDGTGSEAAQTVRQGEGPEKARGDFLAIIQERSFIYLITVEIIRMAAVNTVFTHIMPYLGTVGMSRALSGAVAAALPLISIAGRLGFGWWGDCFDKRVVWSTTFILTSFGILAFCHVRSFWVLILFVLLFGPGYGGGLVLRGSLLQEYFGMASFGKRLGILLGIGSAGGIVGPTLAGWVFDTLGSYNPFWYGLSVISGFVIFLIMKIKPVPSS